ncbi:hypothetical protein Dimus_022656 [Dionaea muscipula]
MNMVSTSSSLIAFGSVSLVQCRDFTHLGSVFAFWCEAISYIEIQIAGVLDAARQLTFLGLANLNSDWRSRALCVFVREDWGWFNLENALFSQPLRGIFFSFSILSFRKYIQIYI